MDEKLVYRGRSWQALSKQRMKHSATVRKIHLTLVRHGQSLWNEKNLFTGWRDIDLSAKGVLEARAAAALLKKQGLVFDFACASSLKRAGRTLQILLEGLDQTRIPVVTSWKLNERHYGALQGMNKQAAKEKYGEKQLMEWRRGFASAPPPLCREGAQKSSAGARSLQRTRRDQERQQTDATPSATPGEPLSESLKDTQRRVLSFWREAVLPEIQEGRSGLVAAHGNSLRALIKHLENISDKDIFHLNIKTGAPLTYEMNRKGEIVKKSFYANRV